MVHQARDYFTMNGWTVVGTKEKKSGLRNCSQSNLLSQEDGVKRFLSSFKTSPCPNTDWHDHRKCKFYHSDQDRRRNPFNIIYFPDDDDIISNVESHYHPMNYLTKMCEQPSGCPYGCYCANAHLKNLLRDKTTAGLEYNDHLSDMTLEKRKNSQPTLGAYTPELKSQSSTAPIIHDHHSKSWNAADHNLPKCSEYLIELPLDCKAWFLVNASDKFFSFLREVAMKEGLAQIEIRNNRWGEGEYGIAVRGSKDARERASEQLFTHLIEPPLQFFVEESKELSSRVMTRLVKKSQTEINNMILGKFASCAFVEFSDNEMIICASNQHHKGAHVINQVFDKLSFWIKQEGLDNFIDCCICCDSFNLDQGVACQEGHFYCGSESGCLDSMVRDQLGRMQHQDNDIKCSICQETIETRSLAPHLSEATWTALEEAKIDSKVKLRVEKLSHDFDKRLEAKIEEFMQEYGSSSDGMLKVQAKQLAKQAQDDIMNLKCPHCKTPYAEFTGCMAIQCGSCKKHFCGYCHHGTESGSGAHSHVRQCLVNETNNGSFYATSDQIKVAQRKHRTRELKKFLQPLKKELQNATVLELEKDLIFHGIEKAALFEFGNLQGELEL